MNKTEVIIVGAGPAGLCQALMLGDAGVRVVLIDATRVDDTRVDNRTAALLVPSVDILRRIHIDAETFANTAPLRHLRLIDCPVAGDGDQRVVDFSAHEINAPYFALNIRNADLYAAFVARAQGHKNVTVMAPCAVRSMNVNDFDVRVETDQGMVQGALVIAADGRHSFVRKMAGIDTTTVDYAQTAITCAISHALPHNDRSIEFHRPGGPLTLVPLSGNRSSVVWMERTADIEQILALPSHDFQKRLYDEMYGVLGDISVVDALQSWPIIWQRATRITAPRVALIAESAHALPPSGAQGLNMSVQDIAALSDIILRAHRCGLDVGSRYILASYETARRLDMHFKSNAVDGLNRIIMTDNTMMRRVRRAGLVVTSGIPMLRRAVMQMGWTEKI